MIAWFPILALGWLFTLPQPKVGETTDLSRVLPRVRLTLPPAGAQTLAFDIITSADGFTDATLPMGLPAKWTTNQTTDPKKLQLVCTP